MTERQDPELVALSSVLRALGGLDAGAQKRVLNYASEKLFHRPLEIDVNKFMENLSKALAAINQAAEEMNAKGPEKTSGIRLINVISEMYERANASASK